MAEETLLALSHLELTPTLLAGGVALARVAPAVWIAPFLGGRLVPASVKTVLTLALAVCLAPQLLSETETLAHGAPLLQGAVLVKETLVGATLGFIVAIVFHAAEAAGRLADVTRGASLAEALAAPAGETTSALGTLYFQLCLVLFISLGGHRLFVTALGASYQSLPLLSFPTESGLRGLALFCCRITADLVLIAVTLAAPVLAALFLADVTLGLINRFVPQANVYFLAMPAKAALGIAVLVLAVGLIAGLLPALLDAAVQQATRALTILGG
jgi:flagellar biosynthetic protein FliR